MDRDAPRWLLNGQTPQTAHIDKAQAREHVTDVLMSKGYSLKEARAAAWRIVEKCASATRD